MMSHGNEHICVGAQNKPKDSHVSQSHCLVSQKKENIAQPYKVQMHK